MALRSLVFIFHASGVSYSDMCIEGVMDEGFDECYAFVRSLAWGGNKAMTSRTSNLLRRAKLYSVMVPFLH